jgi:large subunit ribosomal protein L6
MSRLGKQPVTIPAGVAVSFADGMLSVKGPKGELSRAITDAIQVAIEGNTVTFTKAQETKEAKALWGTYVAHFHNMVKGVTEGFTKVLEIEGVGYRAESQGNKIKFSLGFSHPIEMMIPAGVAVTVEKGVLTVTGNDIEVVGQFAANIRALKKPEPYKGKGIHYRGEYIIRKQGKKGVA